MEISQPQRSLILAGGGLKVAFQAGVLQVWLDEARDAAGKPLHFIHADGSSGGVFNLAMWCQGMTGHEIAERWRRVSPLHGLSPNWRHWLPASQSLLTYDRFRRNVLRELWQLDWERIRSTNRRATFNLFNFTRQQHLVRGPDEMDEDLLVSAVSLPMWFPPVKRPDGEYIDAVFATDANLEAAIAAGSDELWIIWTVSQRGLWRRGLVNHYFQMIEASANSRVRAVLARIEASNAAIANSDVGEFDRRIDVKWLAAEVPTHYLFNYTRAGMREAVDRGVACARDWCTREGLSINPTPPGNSQSGGISFRERMAGTFGFAESDFLAGAAKGLDLGTRLAMSLEVKVSHVDQFLADPRHIAKVSGTVQSEALGGVLPISDGEVALLADDGDYTEKRMSYRLQVQDSQGTELTIFGEKKVAHDARFDLWPDTTTLHVTIMRGRWDCPPGNAQLVGAGVLRLGALSFLHQLLTFRASGRQGRGIRALLNFDVFFLRQLWQVYGRPRSTGSTVGPVAARPSTDDVLPAQSEHGGMVGAHG
jgi:predicted acylesterase/phospholipase RssA